MRNSFVGRGGSMTGQARGRLLLGGMLGALLLLFDMHPAEANLYHATSREAAKRILAKGINPAKFRASARFGKGLYLARRPSTAIAEKGKRAMVIRMKEGSYMKRHILDLRQAITRKIRSLLGGVDLRGGVKRRVIGPKLGHKVGKVAENRGMAIQYRSVKNGGTNLVVPKGLLEKRPEIVRPEKLLKRGKIHE